MYIPAEAKVCVLGGSPTDAFRHASVVVPIYDVVMVDDGSTDGSAAIAESFAVRDRRFRLITQANAGLGHARNTGVAAASGELLALVESDDVVPTGCAAASCASTSTTSPRSSRPVVRG